MNGRIRRFVSFRTHAVASRSIRQSSTIRQSPPNIQTPNRKISNNLKRKDGLDFLSESERNHLVLGLTNAKQDAYDQRSVEDSKRSELFSINNLSVASTLEDREEAAVEVDKSDDDVDPNPCDFKESSATELEEFSENFEGEATLFNAAHTKPNSSISKLTREQSSDLLQGVLDTEIIGNKDWTGEELISQLLTDVLQLQAGVSSEELVSMLNKFNTSKDSVRYKKGQAARFAKRVNAYLRKSREKDKNETAAPSFLKPLVSKYLLGGLWNPNPITKGKKDSEDPIAQALLYLREQWAEELQVLHGASMAWFKEFNNPIYLYTEFGGRALRLHRILRATLSKEKYRCLFLRLKQFNGHPEEPSERMKRKLFEDIEKIITTDEEWEPGSFSPNEWDHSSIPESATSNKGKGKVTVGLSPGVPVGGKVNIIMPSGQVKEVTRGVDYEYTLRKKSKREEVPAAATDVKFSMEDIDNAPESMACPKHEHLVEMLRWLLQGLPATERPSDLSVPPSDVAAAVMHARYRFRRGVRFVQRTEQRKRERLLLRERERKTKEAAERLSGDAIGLSDEERNRVETLQHEAATGRIQDDDGDSLFFNLCNGTPEDEDFNNDDNENDEAFAFDSEIDFGFGLRNEGDESKEGQEAALSKGKEPPFVLRADVNLSPIIGTTEKEEDVYFGSTSLDCHKEVMNNGTVESLKNNDDELHEVLVERVPTFISNEDLFNAFSRCGDLESVSMIGRDKDNVNRGGAKGKKMLSLRGRRERRAALKDAWHSFGVLKFKSKEGRDRALSKPLRCVGMFVRGEPLRTVSPEMRSTLYVRNISYDMSISEVAALMTDMHSYASVGGVQMCYDEKESAEASSGHCLIEYPHYSLAVAALKFVAGKKLGGRRLKTNWPQNK
eukprot:g2435.t1